MMRRVFLVAVSAAATLACSGLFGGDAMDPEVEAALDGLEGTSIAPRSDANPQIFSMEGGGAPTMASGNGVQVVHVAPLGDGRKALQAAVVFDRPMVGLSDLDAMSDVPIACSPDIPHRARWAGTTTAVWIPDSGSFPLAHTFTCSIPAAIAAIDGVTLENRIEWTFETARPKVTRSTPRDNADGIDPDSPIEIVFSQPVSPQALAPYLEITALGGKKIAVEIKPTDDDRTLEVRAPLALDTKYQLTVSPGVVGEHGPLGSTETWSVSFETYPPLQVRSYGPESEGEDPWVELAFTFSTPVTDEMVGKHLHISPEPDGYEPSEGTWASTRWEHWHSFAPRTEYTVRLDADLEDQFGQKLGYDRIFKFTTGDYRPALSVASGFRVWPAHNPTELPLKHLNCGDVFVKVAALPFEEGLRGWKNELRDTVDTALSADSATLYTVPTTDEPNTWELDAVDLAAHMGTGLLAIDTWSPQFTNRWDDDPIHHRMLLVVTSLGVTVKAGAHGSTAWVTSMETGEPVGGADVQFAVGGQVLGSATTNADGIATIKATPPGEWSTWRDPLLAIARKGEDKGVAYHNWADGIEPWRFGMYARWDQDGEDLAGWGFTDRGIYKPGDPVYASAHFRVESSEGLTAPKGGEVSWKLSSPDGGQLATGTGVLDRGNFALQTALPADGGLGDYSLRIEATWSESTSRTVYLSVPSRAYREPAFRVSVHAEASRLQGESLTGHLDARYLFGAPLSGGDVTWRAWSTAAEFEPKEGFEGYWFGPERRWWWEDSEVDSGLGTVGTLETTVAEGTQWELTAPSGLDRPIDVQIEAQVTDVDRQQIAGLTTVRVHPTTAYVGLRPLERMPMEGEKASFEVIAARPDGERALKATTEILVLKRTWTSTREKGVDGRWEYVSSASEEQVYREERQVGADAQTVSWTPDAPGTYILRATRQEDGGRSQVAEVRIYARGKGYASWGIDEDQMLRLVPDKPTYHIGDTAQILVQSPVPGLQALVTVEREGVLWSDVIELEGTATTVNIPISEAWVPNVFVSVVSVEGAPPQNSPDAGRPQVRVGMLDLAVDREDVRLAVAVTTDREVYRPQDPVSVDVVVRNADGSPSADTDVVLYAVDEAVLSLTNYQTPDPIAGLIQQRGLSVFTGDSRTEVVDRAPYLTKGASDAGGGGEEDGPKIRENFITTITWQPTLRTDAHGKLTATFELPDNLTAFRVMAVATRQNRFGSGDREITVTRPIIARPALPRKLRVDDVAFAGVVVHNNTDAGLMATVTGTVEGSVELKGSPVLVQVPAHGAVEVPFRLKATAVGESSFVFEVKAGQEKDAIRWPLTVEEDVPLEVVATSGTTETEATERISKPRTNRTDLGGLTVDIGTSALAGAGSGLDYLLEYPHGCLEQTTSRGLGALVAMRVRTHAGLDLDEAGLREVVDVALRKMPSYRATQSRGLSYWPGGWYDSPLGTAYAVEFMGRAKEAGFQVDEALLSESVSYLRDVLNNKYMRHWDPLDSLQTRAYVVVALARAGQGDAGQNNTLYGQRDNLTIAATANVMEAIARTTGADSRTAALARTLESRTFIDAASASIKENDTGRWARLWGSDDLSTAASLEALMVADGQHALAPKYALHLASSKTSGRWANTRATAGVLSALAAYADNYEKGGDSRTVTVELAGSELLKQALALPEAAHAEVTLADLTEGDLVVRAQGGRVYYEHRLEYAPMELKPRDEGFTVIREVEIVDGGGPDGSVTAGAMLAITLRVVTPVVRHNVAVMDAIPAGWEPLDSSLATTSKAPDQQPDTSRDNEGGSDELPAFGGSWVFDHHEIDDIEVRLYADYMPPGIHTFRYAARATTPGTYGHPPARAEAMYQPEIFGRTSGGTMTVGRTAAAAAP